MVYGVEDTPKDIFPFYWLARMISFVFWLWEAFFDPWLVTFWSFQKREFLPAFPQVV